MCRFLNTFYFSRSLSSPLSQQYLSSTFLPFLVPVRPTFPWLMSLHFRGNHSYPLTLTLNFFVCLPLHLDKIQSFAYSLPTPMHLKKDRGKFTIIYWSHFKHACKPQVSLLKIKFKMETMFSSALSKPLPTQSPMSHLTCTFSWWWPYFFRLPVQS